MNWIPWIEIEADSTVNEKVQEIYRRTKELPTGSPPDIVRLTSLLPEIAGMLYDLNCSIHQSTEGLTKREQEISALIVSSYNG